MFRVLGGFTMSEKRNRLNLFLDTLNKVMVWIGAAMVIFMMLAISYSSIMRYIGLQPGAWVVEISSYLMLYITFLGTAWLQRQNGHVEVDLFLCNLKPRTSAGFRAVTSVGGAVVGFVLAWKGTLVTIDYFRRGVTLMSILNTPQFLLIAIIPIGGILLFIEFIQRIWRLGRIALGKEAIDTSQEEPGMPKGVT